MEKTYYHKSKVQIGQMVRGYVKLYSRDGGKSQVFHDGWSTAEYHPYQILKGKFGWRRSHNHYVQEKDLQMYQDIEDATKFIRFLQVGMKCLEYPEESHVHIFRASGIVSKVHNNHFPEWHGVLFDVSELSILEEVKSWNHGEVVNGK